MLSRPRRLPASRNVACPTSLPVQVIDAIPMPAAVLDERGRIQALNQAWEDASRPGGLVASTDVVGSDYIHELRDEKGFNLEAGRGLADVIESVLAGQRPAARHGYEVESEGEVTAWEAVVAHIGSGDDAHVIVIHRERSAEAMRDAMRGRVEALSVERERHHAVHEDRMHRIHQAQQASHGPMTPVRLQLHMLRSGALGSLNGRQTAALDQIERNVQRLWSMQDRFLAELVALEEPDGKQERTDLNALFEEAVHPFRARCIQAGVRLRVDRTDDGLPVRTDVRGVVQALLVLLDHAIRATPSGGIVWVRLRAAGGRAEIAIHDQDPAMDSATAKALLAEEASEHPLRAVLDHVRGVMEQSGARVRAHCAGAGRGLEVTLRFPLDRAAG